MHAAIGAARTVLAQLNRSKALIAVAHADFRPDLLAAARRFYLV